MQLLISRDRVQRLRAWVPYEHNCPRWEGGSKRRSGNEIQLNTAVLSYTACGLTGRLVESLLPQLTFSGYCETLAKRNLQVCVSDILLVDLNLQLLQLQDYADDSSSGASASPDSLCLQTNQDIAANNQGTIHKHKCVGNKRIICKTEQIYGNNKAIICPSVVHKQDSNNWWLSLHCKQQVQLHHTWLSGNISLKSSGSK